MLPMILHRSFWVIGINSARPGILITDVLVDRHFHRSEDANELVDAVM